MTIVWWQESCLSNGALPSPFVLSSLLPFITSLSSLFSWSLLVSSPSGNILSFLGEAQWRLVWTLSFKLSHCLKEMSIPELFHLSYKVLLVRFNKVSFASCIDYKGKKISNSPKCVSPPTWNSSVTPILSGWLSLARTLYSARICSSLDEGSQPRTE